MEQYAVSAHDCVNVGGVDLTASGVDRAFTQKAALSLTTWIFATSRGTVLRSARIATVLLL